MGVTRHKIAVIGSGFTGATTALFLAQKELGDVVLVDIPAMEKHAQGKALDMMEASPIQAFDAKITATADYAAIDGATLVIITAGIARKPGMSRNDLVSTNANIMKSIAKEVKRYAADAILLVLSNPVDAMTYTLLKETGFPKERIIGQSGILDTARFRTFVAEELDMSVKDITGFVLGGHGDEMVPLLRYAYAGGIPLETLIPQERLDAIVERTRKGGAEIVELLGNGSAYYAPAAALVEMAEVMLKGQRRILPAIAYLEGEYGYEDLCLGVPVLLSGQGIERVIELDLLATEKEALDKSAAAVKEIISSLS